MSGSQKGSWWVLHHWRCDHKEIHSLVASGVSMDVVADSVQKKTRLNPDLIKYVARTKWLPEPEAQNRHFLSLYVFSWPALPLAFGDYSVLSVPCCQCRHDSLMNRVPLPFRSVPGSFLKQPVVAMPSQLYYCRLHSRLMTNVNQ